MRKRLAALVVGLLLLFSLVGCGESYTCAVCDKTTREAYYDANGNIDYPMCKDCAREYWAPLPYESYRIK